MSHSIDPIPDPGTRPASHRAGEILDLIVRAGGSMRITAIAEALGVSEETVRRNVRTLSQEGRVQKVHGGVHLLQETTERSFSLRMAENPLPKQRIAAHLAGVIKNGSSLFLDVGSTTAFIATALQNHTDLFVVTNSVVVAYTLSSRNGNRVFMPGGELRGHDGGVFSSGITEFINHFSADLAILSTTAINARNGFMLYDFDEAQFSRAIMDRAGTRIIAADSSKFGRTAPITLSDPSRVDLLVTDRDPPANIRKAARGWGTEIVTAS